MKIVIEIPDKTYHMIKSNIYDYGDMNIIIQNGTPLPKCHGRLIDADMLKEYARVVEDADLGRLHTVDVEDIDNVPTIIEAESEEEWNNYTFREIDFIRLNAYKKANNIGDNIPITADLMDDMEQWYLDLADKESI